MTTPSVLGMNFAHRSIFWEEPMLTEGLNELWSGGVRKIRVLLPAYTVHTSDTAFRDKLRTVVETALAFTSGGETFDKVLWGLTVSGASNLTNTTMTGAFHDAMVAQITYFAGALTAGEKARFEFQIGNEDDHRIDGTTVTGAQFRTYISGTLVDDCHTEDPDIKISYSVRNDFISSWQSNGIGNLDRLGFNLYKNETTFDSTIKSIKNSFGTKAFISEFGYVDETNGSDYYDDDVEYYNREAWRQMDACRRLSLDCYFFAYDQGSTSLKFTLRELDGTRRPLWYILTAKRSPYISVFSPR